jgi:hypothetical protein
MIPSGTWLGFSQMFCVGPVPTFYIVRLRLRWCSRSHRLEYLIYVANSEGPILFVQQSRPGYTVGSLGRGNSNSPFLTQILYTRRGCDSIPHPWDGVDRSGRNVSVRKCMFTAGKLRCFLGCICTTIRPRRYILNKRAYELIKDF